MILHHLEKICAVSVSEAKFGMPPWANLVGKVEAPSSDGSDLAGGGVYACFWDEALIYIGSFVGPEGSPFGGHVADRIYKHVLGFTLRAKSLGFKKGPLKRIIDTLDHQIADDLREARQLSDALEHGNIMATYNKACFAARHWVDLRDAPPKHLFERFSFGYRRIKPTEASKDTVRGHITRIEKELVSNFKPICNTAWGGMPAKLPAGLDKVAEEFERAFSKKPLAEALPLPNTQSTWAG